MSQSLAKNYIHIIFSTKYREQLIYEPVEQELHAYLASVCKSLECHPVKIGGYTDHIHILCMLSKKMALMELLEQIKSHSSKWMKTKGDDLLHFYWQRGYGAFSISPSEVDMVVDYIDNQRVHHINHSFQNEFRGFLKEYKIDYDERYVWD